MGPLLLEPEGRPEAAVVAFHDAASGPDQFRPAFAAWRRVLPAALFYAPRAPMPCLAAMRGYQWYEIDDIGPGNRAERLAEGGALAGELLDGLRRQFDLPPERVIAAGYSQGAVILLDLLLRGQTRPFGQLLSFSGQPLPPEVPATAPPGETTLDLFHGEEDQVIPLAYANALFGWLGDLGANPRLYVESGVDHGLGEGSINRAAECLQLHLQALG